MSDLARPLATLAGADLPGDLPVTPGHDRRAWRQAIAAWRSAFAAAPPGDVALHLDGAFEFSAALFGAWHAGRTPWLPGDALPATLAQLPPGVTLRAGDLPGALSIPEPGARSPDAAAFAPLDPDACRVVLFTSGSTGEPAGIPRTLRQLDAEIAALQAAFGSGLGDACVIGTVSHQHLYGLLFRVLWPLAAGRPFAPARTAWNEQLAVPPAREVIVVASPAHLKRLPEAFDWSALRASLRAVFSSGGPLPADAARAVRRLWGRDPVEVFGSTETGGVAWRRGGSDAAAWTPLPGVHWRLRNDTLEVRSPHLADDGWHATQDRARAAGDGFELLGRADRIVKIEERRIALDAIERRLLASGLLREARVVALPGHRVLIAVAAVVNAAGGAVLASAGRGALSTRLRDTLAGHVDPIAWPRRWRFVDALPSDARGKTTERALKALFRPAMPDVEWLRRDGARGEVRLIARAGLPAFDGHFPQSPILPGVVLVDWAVRLARDAFALRGDLLRMEGLKFQHLVRPDSELRGTLEWDGERLGFRFASPLGVHASGRLVFRGEGAA